MHLSSKINYTSEGSNQEVKRLRKIYWDIPGTGSPLKRTLRLCGAAS
jgi:hypothetical protein